MRKFFLVSLVISLFVIAQGGMALAACKTIQSGQIVDAFGDPVETGFDEWGYNYQALMFNGGYCDAYRNDAWCQPYVDVDLLMKWNEAWLSNTSCDADNYLDRHHGYLNYVGTGAWLTNHQKGNYLDGNGKKQRWEYFVKIVAVPADSYLVGANVVAADGTVIGPSIWGEFAVVQEIYNDTGTGNHGVLYLSPYSAGFGKFSPVD